MRTGIVGITALGLALTTSTTIASAQVHASVVVVAAPPVTRVHVPPPVISYRPRPIVVIGRPANRVIYVERVAWREPKWWKRRGYRPVRFWYDGQRFYDRPVRIYGVQEIVMFERGGRFYVVDDRGGRPDRDGRYDRHDREWDD